LSESLNEEISSERIKEKRDRSDPKKLKREISRVVSTFSTSTPEALPKRRP
jgi:hypothetical protein